ncbi:DUF5133 domain-containing protein [Streptomyces sp. A475]|uniref:DUF5133 domain-containing protein n=1 Tax=Streptomyces sp. A475 TaxID=3131976 RepID=UPI0030C923DB
MRQAPTAATVDEEFTQIGERREATMITAHPSLLRELIERCETLRHRLAADHSAETARQLEDATYTLCVITGTRQLGTALSAARQMTSARNRH